MIVPDPRLRSIVRDAEVIPADPVVTECMKKPKLLEVDEAHRWHTIDWVELGLDERWRPSALAITLNGAEAKSLGRPGKTVTARLNLTNFKDYVAGR